VRTLIIVVVTFAVTALLVGFLAVGYIVKGGAAAKEPTKVRLEAASRGNLTESIAARAEVEPKTKVEMSARVSAHITDLPYDEGDEVTKGDPDADPPIPASVLVKLDARDLEAALRAAEARREAQAAQIGVERARLAGQRAQLEGSRASLDQARLDLERQSKLLETDDISLSQVDATESRVEEYEAQLEAALHNIEAAEMNLVVLQHNLEAADAEIERARDTLGYTAITSPIDGVVTRVRAEVGEQVIPGTMNNPGTVIIEAADLDEMLLVAQVDETEIGKVRVGQRAVAEIHAYPDEQFEGTVDTIALQHDYGAGGIKHYKTEILLKLGGRRIYSGATADVDIETAHHVDVLRVPSQAVLERPVDDLPPDVRKGNPNVDLDKTFATVVYRCVDGKAVVTPVSIGASDETHTVIESGLDEDEQVVAGPYKVLESLKHDQAVVEEGAADAGTGDGDSQGGSEE
jgi:HlyD family secretion protein